MTSELHRNIRRNALPTAAPLLVLLIALALSLACGAGGGASPECLDTLYSGNMSEETREQLSQPVASMDNAARLATIKALAPSEGYYKINAESAECADFVSELEEWENTDDGQSWHEENGEDIASVIKTTWGLEECEDALDHDTMLRNLRDYFGDLDLIAYRIDSGRESFRTSDDYIYQVSRIMQMDEIYVPKDSFREIEQQLTCTVQADINNKTRSVTNIKVVRGELVQDGHTLRTYPTQGRSTPAATPQAAAPEQTAQPAARKSAATLQLQANTPTPGPTATPYARLEPDPSTAGFTAERGLFKTFTVRTSYPRGVRLVLDPGRSTYGVPKIDFGVGAAPPATTTIQLIPWHHEVTNLDAVQSYTISIPTPTPGPTETPEPTPTPKP